MFRKFVLAIAAVAAIGTVSLAPTSADAGWKFKHGHGHHWKGYGHGFGFYAPVRHYGCFKWVRTYYGWQKINVCHYY